MKAKEMHELPVDELEQKRDEWQHEYFMLRVKHSLGQLDNPLILRAMRRNIARAKTLLAERGVVESTRRRRHTTASSARVAASRGDKPAKKKQSSKVRGKPKAKPKTRKKAKAKSSAARSSGAKSGAKASGS
ncbi:MAG: 50S ribosomal protein L29 [Candidatus Latescibacterota bacterium]|nr:MAG: 50S ribosomal protein L29 [Candidatus Latescibacterota bacterium]